MACQKLKVVPWHSDPFSFTGSGNVSTMHDIWLKTIIHKLLDSITLFSKTCRQANSHNAAIPSDSGCTGARVTIPWKKTFSPIQTIGTGKRNRPEQTQSLAQVSHRVSPHAHRENLML
jgi:hypothetical protein